MNKFINEYLLEAKNTCSLLDQKTIKNIVVTLKNIKKNKFSIIEVNSETDFVAKNDEFIKFVEEISKLALLNSGKMEDILISKMKNGDESTQSRSS